MKYTVGDLDSQFRIDCVCFGDALDYIDSQDPGHLLAIFEDDQPVVMQYEGNLFTMNGWHWPLSVLSKKIAKDTEGFAEALKKIAPYFN